MKYKTTRAMETSTLVFDVAENEDNEKREAKITIHSGDISEVVAIYQEGAKPSIILTQNEYTVSDEGETIAVEVKSGVDVGVEILDNVQWVSRVSSRAMSAMTYYFKVEQNDTHENREARIKFFNRENNLEEIVTINQMQKDALIVSQKDIVIDEQQQMVEFEVRANVEYTVSTPSVSWLHRESTRAMSSQIIHYDVDENTSYYESRTATILVQSNDGSLKETITITQAQKDAIVLAQNSYSISSNGASHFYIKVGSNVDFDIQITGDWISNISTRAFKTETLTFSIAANTERSSREGMIKFISKDGAISQTVEIVQDAVPDIKFRGLDLFSTITKVFGSNITSIKQDGSWYYIMLMPECTDIPDYAFKDGAMYGTDDLYEIIISDHHITSIGKGAFRGCTSLRSVTIGNSVTSIGDFAFYNCDDLYYVSFGNSVKTIGSDAFYNCRMTRVTIPDSVTSIGAGAFDDCRNLQHVTIGNSVTSIEAYTFDTCTDMRSITIGNSVTTIGDFAFQNCNRMASITIPDSVTSIGAGAFDLCDELEYVYCKPTTPPQGGDSMFCPGILFPETRMKIYVPSGSLNAYKSHPDWSEYSSFLIGYNF